MWKTTTGYRNLSTSDIAFQSTLIDAALGILDPMIKTHSSLVNGSVDGPGSFIVMPTTFNAGQETTFELKALSGSASLKPVKEWEKYAFPVC